MDIDFKTIMRDLLNQPAHDASGARVQIDGRDCTYYEALCKQLLNKAFKDGSLGWKILQEAGVVSRTTKEQPQQSHDDYEEGLRRNKTRIKKLLKKANMEDPALELQIELAARDWVAYEKACEDYNACTSDPEEKMKLSEQMRKWSATVRDDLTKLTMNAKDSDRSNPAGMEFDNFLNG